ncbi:hypothetical protein ACWD3J_17390 [Streptomyces sp. NPDC002755]|uniref:hypothetical protein n=1 Tax=Streptomyces sp. NPDC002884 TaxID=3154544 RepID=UPI00331B2E36
MSLTETALKIIIPACAALVGYSSYRRSRPKVAVSFELYSRDGDAYFHVRIDNVGGATGIIDEGVTLHARHRQFSPLRRKYPKGKCFDLEVIEGGDQREILPFGHIQWVARTKQKSTYEALRRISRLRIIVEGSKGKRIPSPWLYRPGRWFWALHNTTQEILFPDPWRIKPL